MIGTKVAGWIAVGISTVITCFWAFWGIVENFHEVWYYDSWPSNIGLMFVQYLSPMLLFMGVALIAIFWPRLGAILHVVLALFAVWFFDAFSNPATLLLILPQVGLGALYWVGCSQQPRCPRPRWLAAALDRPGAFRSPLTTGIDGHAWRRGTGWRS